MDINDKWTLRLSKAQIELIETKEKLKENLREQHKNSVALQMEKDRLVQIEKELVFWEAQKKKLAEFGKINKSVGACMVKEIKEEIKTFDNNFDTEVKNTIQAYRKATKELYNENMVRLNKE